MAGTDVLMGKRGTHQHAEGVWTIGGAGNSLVVDHGDGLLMVDSGPGREVTDAMIVALREISDKPLTHIVISHGHLGYNFGVAQWNAHARSRGDAEPILVGHERVPARYARYRETAGLQAYLNTRQFRAPYPEQLPAHWFIDPSQTYSDELRITGTKREIVLFHAPSETDDATAVWVPDVGVLYGSCACVNACPNVGSPFRTYRDPMRWARTLERFHALAPRVLIPEFGRPVREPQEIEDALTVPVRAIRWLRAEVVARMNRGMSENEILHDIDYPKELFGHRFMHPGYGCGDYMVREIWRGENGWWDRNPTSLHPEKATAVATEVLDLLGDPSQVLARARSLAGAGRLQMALHVVDLVALAPGDAPVVVEARSLKAELLRARAKDMTSAVSRQVMWSHAEELLGEPIGSSDQKAGDKAFSWT